MVTRTRCARICFSILLFAVGAVFGTSAQSAKAPAQRRLIRGGWTLIAGTDPSRLSFGGIDALDLDGDRLITYDYDDHRVKAIDFLGNLLWAIGGSGKLPGEFTNVTDVAHLANGDLWVTDPIVHRVTVLSRDGAVLRTLDRVPMWWRLVPRSDGTLWAFAPPDSTPALYDTTGRTLERLTLSPLLAKLALPSNQLTLTRGPRDSLLITYAWSDRFVIVGSDGKAPREHRGILPQEFPDVVRTPRVINRQEITTLNIDSGARRATEGASWDGGFIYILHAASSADTTSTIDIYRSATGAYVGSRALPEKAMALCVRGDTVAAIVRGPAIRVWKWTPAMSRQR